MQICFFSTFHGDNRGLRQNEWNTSITFEKKEEAIGVLIALEKYKDQHKDEEIQDGVEKLIDLLTTMSREWIRMEDELLRERLALKGDSAEMIAEKTGLSLEDAKMEEGAVKALLGVISAEEIIEQFEL